MARRSKYPPICSRETCERPAKVKGFCFSHYQVYRVQVRAGKIVEQVALHAKAEKMAINDLKAIAGAQERVEATRQAALLRQEEAKEQAEIEAREHVSQFQRDLERGRWDVEFFAKRFLNIRLHPGEIRFANAVLARSKDRWWAPAYYDVMASAGNRAGKTMTLAIVIFHSCVYKMGLKPPVSDRDANRWRTNPYLWYHFAPSQLTANKVFHEIDMMLKGTHPAQDGEGCPLTQELPRVAITDKKFEGEYRWIVLDPILGGAEIHFRTASEKSISSLGQEMNGESLDEAGFDPNLDWEYKNVFHLRRLGTGGQIVMISTPEEGLTSFADYWETGNPDSPDRDPRKMSLRISTRENVGFGIEKQTFEDLIAGMDEANILQNIDGYFIQGRAAYFDAPKVDAAFDEDLPERQAAINKHTYVQGVDPGLKDKCWSLIFDLVGDTLVGVKAEFSRSRTTEAIVSLAVDGHRAYEVNARGVKTTCVTAIDTTALGGHMFRELVQESLPTVRSIEFGGSVQKKRKLLGDLKTMLDKGKIKMPRSGDWLIVRRQLAGYKLNDRSIENDAVMALACVVSEVPRTTDSDAPPVKLEYFATEAMPERPVMVFRRRRRAS